MKIVCIGDSLTSGYGLPREQSWPDLLNRNSDHCWINAGIPGDTSGGVLARLECDALSLKPDSIILMVGYNDILLTGSFESAKCNIMAAMQHCIAAGVSPILGIPPPSRPKPNNPWHGFIKETSFVRLSEEYCEWLRALARAFGYHTADFRELFYDDSHNVLFQSDGIHPSEEGHELMANLF